MNPMQKYPHMTELFACTRKMLAIMFLFLINSLISSETCQHQNYRNKQCHLRYKIKQSNVYLCLHIHQCLLLMPHPLFL